MAQFDTVRSVGVGARAQIDEGLRAHMNKVYGLMSVAMLVTGGAAWAISGLACLALGTAFGIWQQQGEGQAQQGGHRWCRRAVGQQAGDLLPGDELGQVEGVRGQRERRRGDPERAVPADRQGACGRSAGRR